MTFTLLRLGTAVPAGQLNQTEALICARRLAGSRFDDAKWLDAVYQRSGIGTRHQVLGRELVEQLMGGDSVSPSPFFCFSPTGPSTAERMSIYAEQAPPLAVQAARRAWPNDRLKPEEITHLVTVSCTGFVAPGVDRALMTELGLPNDIQRVNVGFMGCHGAINGLRVAKALVEADRKAKVLLVAVELCSLHYYYGDAADKIVANALFADGAAALFAHASEEPEQPRLLATGSCLLPDTAELMSWQVGDFGFEMTLARTIPHVIQQQLRPWLADWLAQYSLSLDAVKNWAIHPGGPRILEAVQQGLGLPDEALAASRAVFHRYGNMSSPTVLFILQELLNRGASGPGVMLAFGPGLTAEVALWG